MKSYEGMVAMKYKIPVARTPAHRPTSYYTAFITVHTVEVAGVAASFLSLIAVPPEPRIPDDWPVESQHVTAIYNLDRVAKYPNTHIRFGDGRRISTTDPRLKEFSDGLVVQHEEGPDDMTSQARVCTVATILHGLDRVSEAISNRLGELHARKPAEPAPPPGTEPERN